MNMNKKEKNINKLDGDIAVLMAKVESNFRKVAEEKANEYIGERVEDVNGTFWDLFCAGVMCGLYEATVTHILAEHEKAK